MLEHVHLIKQHEIAERHWSLTAHSFPHMSSQGQKKVINDLKVSEASLKPARPSAFERVRPERRVEMIGSMLSHHGDEWVKRHRSHLAWLRQQGFSPAESMRRHEAKVQAELSRPIWRPAKKRKRKGRR